VLVDLLNWSIPDLWQDVMIQEAFPTLNGAGVLEARLLGFEASLRCFG